MSSSSDKEEESIETILSSKASTKDKLIELLTNSLLLDELLKENKSLIRFLTLREVLVIILRTAITTNDLKPDRDQYKHAHICRILLTIPHHDKMVNSIVTCEATMNLLVNSLNDPQKTNNLLASFLKQILELLLNRQFSLMLDKFEAANFLDKCIRCLQFGAISEFLQNIINHPRSDKEMDQLIDHLSEMELARTLISQLDSSFSEPVQRNSAAIFERIVRDWSVDLDPNSANHRNFYQSFFFERITHALIDNLYQNDALMIISTKVLTTMIESTKHVGSPSDLINNKRVANHQNELLLEGSDNTVQIIVARNCGKMIEYIVCDFTRNKPSDKCFYLMRLLVALFDTNCSKIHETIVRGMKAAGFHQLFDLVSLYPLLSSFHGALRKLVQLVCYSSLKSGKSPLLAYLFEEFHIFKFLLSGMRPWCVLPKLRLIGLQTFHVFMVMEINDAIECGPNSLYFKRKLKRNTDYVELSQLLLLYLENNPGDKMEREENSHKKSRRTLCSTLELPLLEKEFEKNRTPSSERLKELCDSLNMNADAKERSLLTVTQIYVWFRNRRNRLHASKMRTPSK